MSHSKKTRHHSLHHLSHAFPSIQKESADNSDPCKLFKPMFNKDVISTAPNHSGSQTKQPKIQDDPLEQAGQRGFERGLMEGRLSACEMVQNEVSPVTAEVQRALDQYDEYRQQLSDQFSVTSLKLALSIVQRICGSATELELAELTEARTIIHDAIHASFGFEFLFNPQDFKAIEQLMTCNALEMEKYMQITIRSNENINSGALTCLEKHMEWDSIYQQVASAIKEAIVTPDTPPVE